MIILEKHFQLKNEAAIDEASELLDELMTAEQLDRKQILRLRLSVEEVMLRWRDNDISGICKIIFERKFGNLHLEIVKDGVYCDPYNVKSYAISDEDAISRNLMAKLGIDFKFAYWRGSNYLSYTIEKKKKGQLWQLGIAIPAAMLLGMFINRFLPNMAQPLTAGVLIPLINCFFGFFGAVVGPFMFLSVVCGFCGVGELSSLGRISKILFGRFFRIYMLSSVVIGAVMFPFVKFASETGVDNSDQISAIFNLVINIVPSNFVDSFLSGNVLQIIFTAVLVGFVLILIRPLGGDIISILEQCNEIFNAILRLISALLPVFIFVNILKLILSNSMQMFRGVWWLFAVCFIANFILFGIQAIIIPLKERVSPLVVFKKMMPTFLISLTTASSASSLPANFECCEKKFGIEEQLTKVSVPLGIVVLKIGTAIYLSALSIFCANVYNVPITLSSFIMALFISAVLAVATPPVVGGAVASCTMLFIQMGIPLEALSLAVTIEMIIDFFNTAFNVAHIQLQILHASDEMKMIKTETLKARI